MAVRSALLCFAIAPLLLVSSANGEKKLLEVSAVEDIDDMEIAYDARSNSLVVVDKFYIADFAESSELTNWEDRSDSLDGGASKWAGVWHNTTAATGGLFFFVLYPGSTDIYAAGRKTGTWDLSQKKSIRIRFLALGYPTRYRVICRTNGADGPTDPLFDMRFKALNTTSWQRVTLPLDEFVPSVQGVINNTLTFDTSKLTSVAIASYGGVGTDSMYIKDITAI